MLAIIPLLFFIFCFLVFYRNGLGGLLAREAFLLTCLAWGVAVVVINEVLSLGQHLTLPLVVISWMVLLVVMIVITLILKLSFLKALKLLLDQFLNARLLVKLALTVLVLIAIQRLFTAVFCSPNTWDGLTYHLPRVEHWIQNRTVAPYPTHVPRQISYPPFAEYAILQWRILTSGDYFSNFVQCFSMIGSLITVSLLARQLGASVVGQCLASLLLIFLPMGIVQSVSTQTDYVATFWFVSFVYWLWQLYISPSLKKALIVGVALGLATLSKGTPYIFALPCMMVFLGATILYRRWINLRLLAVALAFVVIINGPYWQRNQEVFKNPFGISYLLTNGRFGWDITAANLLRNVGVHLSTPVDKINQVFDNLIKETANVMLVELNAPQGTFGELVFKIHKKFVFIEDYVPNTLFVLMSILALVLFLIFPFANKRLLGFYVLLLFLMFLLFCFVIRFQIWNSRFHLPLFVLAAPFLACVFAAVLRRWSILLIVVIMLGASPWLFKAFEHPWIGPMTIFKMTRMQQYLVQYPGDSLRYQAISKYIKSQECREIGLIQGEDSWEYPWWIALRAEGVGSFRFEHVDVRNQTAGASYPLGDFEPCLVLSHETSTPTISINGTAYIKIALSRSLTSLTEVFIPVTKFQQGL